MPFEFEVKDKTRHIEVKYDNDTLEVKHEDFIKGREMKMKTNSDRKFMMGCITGGVAVAAIGVTSLILKKPINLRAIPFARKSAIFEVAIPSDHEREFEEFVNSGKLTTELQREFENIESHLEVLGVTTGYSDNQDEIIQQLKKVKIVSVEICSQEIAEKAFEDMYAKEAFAKPKRQRSVYTLEPPKNLSIREGPKSPSTQIFASYDTVMGADGYIVTAHDLESGKKVQKFTPDGFCIVDGLEAGHSYIVGVKSSGNGGESSELVKKDFVRTAMYDPFPWRRPLEDDGESIKTQDMYGGGSIADQTSGVGSPEFADESDLPELWSSNLHLELRKIFKKRFDDGKMKRLLCKCDELGITEARDLKFVESKEVAEEFKGTVKIVEILKLIDYATDQYGSSTQESKDEKGGASFVINSQNLSMKDSQLFANS